jgi:hypothetical protein
MFDMSRLAKRVANKYLTDRIAVEGNIKRNVESILELMNTAKEAMALARQHSRGLYAESSLQWIPDYMDSQLKEFKEFIDNIENAVSYVVEQPIQEIQEKEEY